ncbi:DUF3231 family protein [Virgibacillus siamensis]|uniref:DUF3231 family protein n=1 Tax=Virgibacillus siamensis TaxID=480071 RepID=UPI00158F4AEF|nr:DUF3231 family protein [Virgibacillus siamensis]
MPKNLGNIFQSAIKVLNALTDNNKDPLHMGEVMACWTYLAFVGNIITYEEVGLNSITDPELKEMVKDALNIAKTHKKELTEFMKKEGIALPSLPETKPKSDPGAIPPGAKLTEDELINTLEINFVFAADTCAASASQCLRTDVGLMFLKFQTDKFALGFRAKELMRRKGWLKIPPHYRPPGAPGS